MTQRAAAALTLAVLVAGAPAAAASLTQAAAALRDAAQALAESDAAGPRAQALEALEGARGALRHALRRNLTRRLTLTEALAARRKDLLRLDANRSTAARAPVHAWAVRPEGPLVAARALARAQAGRSAASSALDGAALDLAEATARAEALESARLSVLSFAIDAYAGDPPQAATAAALLSRVAPPPPPARLPGPRPAAPGDLPAPVPATVLYPFGAPDRLGRPTPGITLSAPAGAALRAPGPVSVLIAEPLPHRGLAAVLELAPGRLLILADLSALSVEAGATLPAGALIGHVGVRPSAHPDFAVELPAPTESPSEATLYMEARQDGAAVDPALWFNGYREAPSP